LPSILKRFSDCLNGSGSATLNLVWPKGPNRFERVVNAVRARSFMIVALTCLLALGISGRYIAPPANAIGLANVVVTNVYWGTNSVDPSTAHPGDVNIQLSVVLTNVGDDVARGVNATLIIGPPLSYTYNSGGVQYTANSVSKIAGDMSAAQSFTLGFTVSVDSNAKEGIYRYNLQISYRSARELQQIANSVMIDVPVWKGELHVQNVVTVPTKIYPDSKQVAVKVSIVNSGRGTAKDVQLRLNLMPPFAASSSGSDRIFVGNVPAGQTSDADFIVDIASDAPFGEYAVVLGEEVGGNLVSIGQIPLYVNEKVKFDIVSVSPATVHAGDSGDVIRVEIKNAGTIKANSVRVQLRVGNFFTGTLTDFLGTMLPGETKVAFFTVDIDSKAQSRQYNLDLRFDWTQDENALDNTQTVTLTVAPAGVPMTLIMVIVVVLAVVASYLFIRRRRMKAAQTPTK